MFFLLNVDDTLIAAFININLRAFQTSPCRQGCLIQTHFYFQNYLKKSVLWNSKARKSKTEEKNYCRSAIPDGILQKFLRSGTNPECLV